MVVLYLLRWGLTLNLKVVESVTLASQLDSESLPLLPKCWDFWQTPTPARFSCGSWDPYASRVNAHTCPSQPSRKLSPKYGYLLLSIDSPLTYLAAEYNGTSAKKCRPETLEASVLSAVTSWVKAGIRLTLLLKAKHHHVERPQGTRPRPQKTTAAKTAQTLMESVPN